MKAAWFCPACQKHHAPHVETCPGHGNLYKTYETYSLPVQACGCASEKCRSEGCQAQKQRAINLGWYTPGLFGGAAQ